MTPTGHNDRQAGRQAGRRRLKMLGLLTFPLAIAGLIGAGAALGAGSTGPSMEVLPKTTGLKYSQTVEVKGHHLPKGSGSVAATICGLQDASGKTIASPTADDCAGASEIGKLVVVKSWQSNGEFDTQYTLPASGKTFGKNARFCNRSHRCALVVADANPDKPAYYIITKIQFFDQASTTTTTKPKTTTTKPKGSTKPTPTTTTEPASGNPEPTTGDTEPEPSDTSGTTATTAANGSASSGSSSGSVKAGASVTIELPGSGAAPTLPANPIPAPVAQALDQACTQLANAVKQAGGDPTALLTACSSLKDGSGPQQLQAVLQSPSLLCIVGASAWQNNPQVTDACNQAATALAPVTSQVAGALSPILGGL